MSGSGPTRAPEQTSGPDRDGSDTTIAQMTADQHSATLRTPAGAGAVTEKRILLALQERAPDWRVALRHLGLPAVLVASAVLNVHRLSQNGYANIFYSAGVKSMLRSLHNFVFVSFDPGGLIMVDKPPLGLWTQAASAKLFGFSPMSLLLPEAIIGVLSVAALYWILNRSFGPLAATVGALALAVFPSFVAVSRDNGVDPLLILLMVLACCAALRAVETGGVLALLACAVFVGLAFNTKTLAAYLVVPGIALAYLCYAPGSMRRRAGMLLAGGLATLLVSFSWIALVELTPARERPFVGGSTNNTEIGLTFGYNGFGRVGGQVGGPGQIPVGKGALLPLPATPVHVLHRVLARELHDRVKHGQHLVLVPRARRPAPAPGSAHSARAHKPIPFGGPPGPLRLFGVGLGDQGGWYLPFAFFGLLAAALVPFERRRRPARTGAGTAAPEDGRAGASAAGMQPAGSPRTRDLRPAALMILGGWFAVEAAVLSLSKGIVHPYYVSALGPGAAAVTGAGAVALAALAREHRDWRLLLLPCAVIGTVAAEIVLLRREHYMHWFIPVLLIGALAGLAAALALRRVALPAMALTLALLLVAPAAYSRTTWLAPVEGTFPAAGPTQAAGVGGVGLHKGSLRTFNALIRYGRTHHTGSRWAMLTDASDTAAPMILLGLDAGAVAGYSGTDPALSGPGLARLVARREARYVVLGGAFASRGGNGATAAVLAACRLVGPTHWGGPPISRFGLVLFDCGGRERKLAAS